MSGDRGITDRLAQIAADIDAAWVAERADQLLPADGGAHLHLDDDIVVFVSHDRTLAMVWGGSGYDPNYERQVHVDLSEARDLR